MRIAFNGYFWGQPRTGSGQYLRHLWDELNKRASSDNSFTLLLPPGGKNEQGSVDTAWEAGNMMQGKGLPVMGGRVSSVDKVAWEGWGVAWLAKRARADLLHVPYLSAPFPLFRSNPVVVTAHDMIPWVIPGYAGSASVKLYLRLAAACVKSAQVIMADSEASRRDVICVLGVPGKRVHTVYLGVEDHPPCTAEQIAEARARLGLPENYAFYLGGFDKRKNVPLLLRAWRAALTSLESAGECGPLLAIGGDVPAPGGVFPRRNGRNKTAWV